MSRRWYIVGTYSGYENSVKQDLERRMETMNMTDKIYQVIVPEETTQVVDKKERKRKSDEDVSRLRVCRNGS